MVSLEGYKQKWLHPIFMYGLLSCHFPVGTNSLLQEGNKYDTLLIHCHSTCLGIASFYSELKIVNSWNKKKKTTNLYTMTSSSYDLIHVCDTNLNGMSMSSASFVMVCNSTVYRHLY
jgi:hypothetical protein